MTTVADWVTALKRLIHENREEAGKIVQCNSLLSDLDRFTTNLLSLQRQEMIEEVEKLRDYVGDDFSEEWSEGYRHAIDDVIKLLTE